MKTLLAIVMLFVMGVFANDNYKDGSPCNCDSLSRTYYWKDVGGGLNWETPYVNGKRHGISRGYAPEGWLMTESPYINGKGQGAYVDYNEDGSVRLIVIFANGKRVMARLFSNSTLGVVEDIRLIDRNTNTCTLSTKYPPNYKTDGKNKHYVFADGSFEVIHYNGKINELCSP